MIELFKIVSMIRRGSGANINFFRPAAESRNGNGIVTVMSYGASDEHPMSTRSASDGDRRKAGIWKYAAMVLVLLMLGLGNAWGNSHSTHYGKAVLQNQTGHGTVYLSTASGSNSGQTSSSNPETVGGQSWITWNCGASSGNDSKTYYARYSAADDGWYFAGWSDNSNATSYTASTTGKSFSASSTSSGSPTTTTIYGFFKPVTVTGAPANVNINATDPLATYPDAGGVVLSFATANSNKIGDFTTGASGDAHFVIADWARASASSATFNYKFVGNGSYGETDRTFTKTVTLTSKGDASTRSCTLTAKYPNPKVVSGDDSEEYTNIFTAFAAVGDQAAVTKTAVFDVVYADDENNFSAAFSGITGGGTWNVTGIIVDQNNQKATVTYTFNGNKAEGTHTALLTLSAKDCNGWNDTEADGSASASVTITATNEQEATNDVSVTTAAGVTTEYATWADGLTAANASAGSTLKLLRDVDLTGTYGITATQGITQTMTLDLNGKTLSASTGGSILNPKTSGKTLTIKDSKTGGKIQNIADLNGALYAINVGAGVTLNVESGYIYVENLSQYAYGTSTYTDGTPNISSMQARGIHMAATSKVNISGGKIHAVASCNAFGVREESSKANNTVLTITGGEIIGEAPRYAYGIYAGGKVNISGGTVTALLNDKTVNGNTTYTANAWNDYTLHRYGYGIQMFASSNATAANCYFGTLTITGGTINAINVNKTLNGTTVQSEHTYGIMMYYSMTGAGAGKTAPDGSKVMKASAIGSIENATINVTHAGSTAYGIMAYGTHNSFDNSTTPLQIKNTTINVEAFASAYGVYANVYVNWSSTLTALTGNGGCTAGEFELTNTTINATTTGGAGAYCAWASATSGTVANAKATTGSTSTGNATYYGEYAVAGKITVNSGTYTANAATSSAYAIGSTDRAKCVRNVNGVFANRDAVADPQGALSDNTPTSEAYPELNIHGGNFSATTGTTTAIAVKSGGNTLIDGGTFNAYAGGSTAYGLYVTAGKTVANGVTFPASATTVAYGVYVFAAISDWSLFPYAGEVELNNCNATATARTTTDARGVYVYGLSKVYTQASFDAMKTANNSNYKNYGDYAQVGERSIVGKATINGGTYSATAETTTAYGIVVTSTRVSTNKEAIAYNPLVVRNATVTAKTNTGTTAYGVQPGGGGLIENCTITATAGTTTASGVRAIDKTTVIKNSTISAKGTDAVYGLEGYVSIDATHGYCWHGEYDLTEAGNTKVTAESTGSSKPAYAIYLKATKRNIASGNFAGDYVIASDATINEGTYIAKINGGTSGYALALDAQQIQGSVVGQSEVLINGGKFNGATAEVGTAGVVGHVQLKGGYYVHNTNLSKYIPEGYEEFPLPNDRPEYTEGYRYAIEPAGMHGIDVCQIGSTKYKSLEEALQVVTSGQVIYMIANYTMASPGDYVLPANTTLLIPYKTGSGKGATTAIGNSAETTTSATTPVLFRKLTFGNGVNLVCYGTIETSAQQKANGQYGANVGMPSGAYGQIQMDEGSHISMESGSRLNCWGYITGKGTINVKNNATVLEGFQLGDWCGGTNATTLTGSSNKGKAFPITHYFYQSIECPITYRPGAKALGSTHVNMSFVGTVGQDAVPLVGTSDAMFIMDNVNASEDTWVMKDYDEETDYCYWTINSGASIGNLIVKIPNAIDVNSADYVLPICSNMAVVLNYGEGSIGQHAVFLPGSKLIINKEGTLVLKNVNVSMLDLTEYTGATIYRATYSPTWGTTNPRSTSVNDAEVFVHGKVELKNNGGLYTSASGANIHSTNSDAGQVLYTSAAQSDKTTYYLKSSATSATAVTVNAAKLLNEDNTYSSTASTSAGDVWVYVNGKWTKKTKEGCFSVETTDKKHYFIQPSDIVEVNYPAQSNNTYTSVTGSRVFVWDEDCYWWEVETTPTAEGYFKAITPDHNGKYNYYYYDSSAACWKIKTITVTWNINGSTTDYSVGYGTKPEWLGATPTKTSSSSDYVWRWDGWTKGSDATVIANNDLPFVTENTTFTAHFYEKYYEYNVTFKNSDGTILESKNWIAGTTPSYEGTPTKNPTAAETYEFNGTWTPAIAVVSGSATYTANYTSHPRAYTITFLNYDMSELGMVEVVYNGTPSNETYLTAVAPLTENPYKPDNSAYSFEFSGWRLQGADENGFAQVKGKQTYIAQFAETTKKYRIEFMDEDGETLLHWTQLEFGETPSYTWDNPANKQDVEWNYTFSGWTPEFTEVEGRQTYTAVYNKTKREYTIIWLNDDNSQIGQTSVAYGEVPTHVAATKEPDAQYTYTFAGWSPEPAAVTGETTYKATYTTTLNVASVTANEGTTYYTSITSAFEAAKAKTNPTIKVLQDVSLGATSLTYDGANTCTLDLNGHTISGTGAHALLLKINNTNAIFIVTDNTKDKLGKISLTTSNTTNAAAFCVQITSGTLQLEAGTIYLYSTSTTRNAVAVRVDGGSFIMNGGTAQIEVTEKDRAAYAMQSLGTAHATVNGGNAIAKAGKGSAYITYVTGYMTISGGKFHITGPTASVINTSPTPKQLLIKGGYYNITGGLTNYIASNYHILATTAAEREDVGNDYLYKVAEAYTITFKNGDDNTIQSGLVEKGQTPAYTGATPTKTATAQYTYTFNNTWSPAITSVTGDATYTAQFGSTVNDYTITWVDGNGETLKTEQVAYGQTPAYTGATPTKTATAQYTYTFNNTWSPAIVAVTEEATYTAQFGSTVNKYTITWVDGNGETLKTEKVEYGQTPSYTGETPTKTATAQYTYTFNNTWSPAIVSVTGDATYTAQFGSTVNEYTITWVDGNGETLKTEQVAYGQTPAYIGATPTKTATAQYTYTFNNTWSPAIEAVTENTNYTAQFSSTVNKYHITWVVKLNGETLDTKEEDVEYGEIPSYGSTPTHEPTVNYVYEFSGWDPEITPVTGDQAYTGTFEAEARKYTIRFVNDNDVELQSSEVAYGTTPVYEGTPVSSFDATAEFTGWTPEIVVVGGEATYKATYLIPLSAPIVIESKDSYTVSTNTSTSTTTVKVEGTLSVENGAILTTDALILEGTPNSSGEIKGAGTVNAGRAYFDLSNGDKGFSAGTWYAVAVPWQVAVPAGDKIHNGVYITNDGETFVQQELGRSFDLIYYDGDRRAKEGPRRCWQYVEDDFSTEQIMYPGRAYMIYLTSSAKTIRFERKEGAELLTSSLQTQKYESTTGNGTDADWNGIANPATYHAYLNVGATKNKAQVYNPDTKGYEWLDMSENKLIVGQPIFVQPAAAATVVASDSYGSFSAPRHANGQTASSTNYEVMLAASDADVSDRIIVSANEDKEVDEYIVGQDLVKLGVSSVVPQMWINRYNSQMSINTVAPEENVADYPLGIFAPKNGEYDLFLEDEQNTESALYLTYDGEAIWNLSYGGYQLNLEKGTNNHYGLRIVVKAPQVTTGMEEATILNGEQVRKVIVNDLVYIIRNGEIYTVTGNKVQ